MSTPPFAPPQQAPAKSSPQPFGSGVFGAANHFAPGASSSLDASKPTNVSGPLLSSQAMLDMPAMPPSGFALHSNAAATSNAFSTGQPAAKFGGAPLGGFGGFGGAGAFSTVNSAPASSSSVQATTASVTTSVSKVKDMVFGHNKSSNNGSGTAAAAAPPAPFSTPFTASAVASASKPIATGTTSFFGSNTQKPPESQSKSKPIYLKQTTGTNSKGVDALPSDMTAKIQPQSVLCPQAIANKAALVRLHEGHLLTRAAEELCTWYGLLEYRNDTLDEVERLMDRLEKDLDASEAELDAVDQLEKNLFFAYTKASGTRGAANAVQSKVWLEHRDAFFAAMKRHGSTWESCLQRLSALEAAAE